MFKPLDIRVVLAANILLLAHSVTLSAGEISLVADIDARAEYNDNIFLTSAPHDAVSGVIITPSISGIFKEEHWQTALSASLRINRYSDPNIDSTDQFFDLTGRYIAQRNIFSLNVNHDLDSNLNSVSSDFGITGRRVNRKRQSITPSYTRLVSERAVLYLSYTYTDIDYLDAENTGFTPNVSESVAASFLYDLTERDEVTISLTAVDYASKNDLVTYQLLISRLGIEHELTETLSVDFTAGVSRRDSTNLSTQSFDFFGNEIILTQEVDFSDRGFVLDAGITQLFETGQIEARLSRDNQTNSFGGLDQVDRFKVGYLDKISELWRYNIIGRFEDVTSISSGSFVTDRELFFFEATTRYFISKDWSVNGSYRYIMRRFDSDTSDNKAPHSNRIYVGLTYNFPPLSTF